MLINQHLWHFMNLHFIVWRRWESNQPSQSTDISIVAGAIDFFDYVFDYVLKNKRLEIILLS